MNPPADDDAVWCVWCVIVKIVNSQWSFQTKLNLVWNFQDIDNGHQNFPNQSEFGLESASCKISFYLSKPNWIWFGKGHWIKCSSTERRQIILRGVKIENTWGWEDRAWKCEAPSWLVKCPLKNLTCHACWRCIVCIFLSGLREAFKNYLADFVR